MQLTENLFEVLGKATCDFANLPSIASAADVERHFPWIALHLSDAEAALAYPAERDELRRLLDALIALDGDVDSARDFRQQFLRPAFNEKGETPARHFAFGELFLGDDGLELQIPDKGTRGVRTAWLMFLDSALNKEWNGRYLRSRRIGKCKNPECETPYFIRRTDARLKLFCSKRCKKKVNG